MYKSAILVSLLALTAFGWQPREDRPYLQFKEEQMILEYTVTENEAVIVFEAETENALDRVEIRSPAGVPILNIRAQGGQNLALSGFVLETQEVTPQAIMQMFPEGIYDLRARTADGRYVLGSAVLSHELLPAPVHVYPLDGAINVPTTNLTVSWVNNPTSGIPGPEP